MTANTQINLDIFGAMLQPATPVQPTLPNELFASRLQSVLSSQAIDFKGLISDLDGLHSNSLPTDVSLESLLTGGELDDQNGLLHAIQQQLQAQIKDGQTLPLASQTLPNTEHVVLPGLPEDTKLVTPITRDALAELTQRTLDQRMADAQQHRVVNNGGVALSATDALPKAGVPHAAEQLQVQAQQTDLEIGKPKAVVSSHVAMLEVTGEEGAEETLSILDKASAVSVPLQPGHSKTGGGSLQAIRLTESLQQQGISSTPTDQPMPATIADKDIASKIVSAEPSALVQDLVDKNRLVAQEPQVFTQAKFAQDSVPVVRSISDLVRKPAPVENVSEIEITTTRFDGVTSNSQAGRTHGASPTPQFTLATNIESVDWSANFNDKVQQILKGNIKQAEIRLDPPHLGKIEVKIDIASERTAISFHTDQVVVREAIDSAVTRLREQLNNAGFDRVDVDVSSDSMQKNNESTDRGKQYSNTSEHVVEVTTTADTDDDDSELLGALSPPLASGAQNGISLYA